MNWLKGLTALIILLVNMIALPAYAAAVSPNDTATLLMTGKENHASFVPIDITLENRDANSSKTTAITSAIAVPQRVAAYGKPAVQSVVAAHEAPAADKARAYDDDETSLSDLGYYESNGEIVIYSYTGTSPDLVVPSRINGMPVSIIGDGECIVSDPELLQTVTLPDTVTSIAAEAFRQCVNLKSVQFPNGYLSHIGGMAFVGCDSLEEINIFSSGDLRIAPMVDENGGTFANCDNLRTISIACNGSLYLSGTDIFAYCAALENAELSAQDVLLVGPYTFRDCEMMQTATLATEGSAKIREGAFSNAFCLNSVTLPEGPTVIEHFAFQNCQFLSEMTILPNVTSIGESVFTMCGNQFGGLTIQGCKGSYVESYIQEYNTQYDLSPEDEGYISFACVAAPQTEGYITVSDYKINGATHEVTVALNDKLSFGGIIDPSAKGRITAVQISVYDASAEVLGKDGDYYQHIENLNDAAFDLSSIPEMIAGAPFGEKNYQMLEGHDYVVMLYATDTNENGFEDLDSGTYGYQGPSILVHVQKEDDTSKMDVTDTGDKDEKWRELLADHASDDDIVASSTAGFGADGLRTDQAETYYIDYCVNGIWAGNTMSNATVTVQLDDMLIIDAYDQDHNYVEPCYAFVDDAIFLSNYGRLVSLQKPGTNTIHLYSEDSNEALATLTVIVRNDAIVKLQGYEYIISVPEYDEDRGSNCITDNGWDTIKSIPIANDINFDWAGFLSGMEFESPTTSKDALKEGTAYVPVPDWKNNTLTRTTAGSDNVAQFGTAFAIGLFKNVLQNYHATKAMITFQRKGDEKRAVIELGSDSTPARASTPRRTLSLAISEYYGPGAVWGSGKRADKMIKEAAPAGLLNNSLTYDMEVEFSDDWANDYYYAYILRNEDGQWGMQLKF